MAPSHLRPAFLPCMFVPALDALQSVRLAGNPAPCGGRAPERSRLGRAANRLALPAVAVGSKLESTETAR